MKYLLLVAHGSRRAASNDEVRSLVRRMCSSDSQFDVIESAFLELAEPSIPEGIDQAIRAGASEVTVLPYFLSAGRHVSVDIPAEVEKARKGHTVPIRIAPYLGEADAVVEILLNQAAKMPEK